MTTRSPLLEAGVAAYLAAGDAPRAAAALADVSGALILSGRPAEAAGRIESSLEAVGASDDEGHARLFAELARSYMLDWRPYEVVVGACDRSLVIAERLDLVSVIADVLITKGTALTRDHAREGMALLVGALALGESRDDVHAQLRALNNIGGFIEDDDPAKVVDYGRRGMVLARRMGSSDTVANFEMGVAWSSFLAGRPREALADLEAIDEEGIGPFVRAQIDTGREVLKAVLGDSDGAAEVRRSLEEQKAAISNREFLSWDIGNRAYLALLDGRIDEGAELARAFVATDVEPFFGNLIAARCDIRRGDIAGVRTAIAAVDAAPRKGRAVEARRLALRAALAALEERHVAALDMFAEAFRGLRELGLLFDLACHQLDMAVVMAGTPQADGVAHEARVAFETMGARSLVAQLDPLMDRGARGGGKRGRAPVLSTPTEVS